MIKKRQPKNVNLRLKDSSGQLQSTTTTTALSSETIPHSENEQHHHQGTTSEEGGNNLMSTNDDHQSQLSSQPPKQQEESTSTPSFESSSAHESSSGADHQMTHSADEEDDDINSTLEKTKLKQKLRSRPKGMQANLKTGDLFNLDKIKNTSVKRKKEQLNILQGGTQGGLVDRSKGDWIAMKLANMEKKESSSTMSQLGMDLNFTDAELSEQDKRLFEYIREKMKEKGYSYDQNVNIDDSDDEEENQQATASSSHTPENDAKKKSDISVKEILEKEKELYKLPEELKVDKIEIENLMKRRGRRRNEQTNQPTKPLSEEERQKLLSGAILEVPLSAADKIQNIRETNERVKELEESGLKRKYTYNTASDEYVYTQFKKKFAHRR
ncbi:hypothetical protein FDP41_000948 [Naegleria fowleri]|uniref:Uncharacterized protein n=1 Tax=Naegleria fowleri TaxID=5763 RepID=A0A6A5C2Q2_NAEFO|nr:uncharacterized protein FDP41_000948 [Naegleria fowleri]KAF0979795.1 hypothetical protein FDP41_000948 [Naegleria fowleri]CAG4712983.1 unnamed protein product [Naegleria fowleri]